MENKTKILASLGITVSIIAGAVAGDYYLNTDIDLGIIKVTQAEYNQLKPAIVEKVKNMKQTPLSHEEARLWIVIGDREIKKCGKANFQNITEEKIIQKINNLIINGCP